MRGITLLIVLILFMSIKTYGLNNLYVDNDTCSVNILQNDTIITSNTTVQIQLTASSGAESYHWTPSIGLSNDTISNPIAIVENTIQYVVETYYFIDTNLVYNGDFELGNVGFTSQLNYSTDLWPASTYNVVSISNRDHFMFLPCTQNGGNFFCGNGASIPNLIVYQTTVVVEPNNYYEFSFDAANVAGATILNQLSLFQFSVNSQQLGDIFSVSSDPPCTWNTFSQIWHSGNNTSATITILNQ